MQRTQAQRCASIDAMVGDPDDCDPRAMFNRRAELGEDTWPEYKAEYMASFERRSSARRGPTPADLRLVALVHATAASLHGAARFGDRKVFISAIWKRLTENGHLGGTDQEDLIDFKSWLVRMLPMSDAAGAPLMLIVRADLVSAMDPVRVSESETVGNGAVWHFVLDKAIDQQAYAPRRPSAPWTLPADARRGGVGGGR